MGKRSAPESALAQPGPHGYPVRFGVRTAGWKGYKIYGADHKEPVRYIELHTHRLSLHDGAHKRSGSPALVTVNGNWSVGSQFPEDDHKPTYILTVHSQDSIVAPDGTYTSSYDASTTAEPATSPTTDQIISLAHTHCRPVTFQFQLPVTTATSSSSRTTTTLETFEWRRAPINCHETRGIRSRKLPGLKTGDPRPPPEKRVWHPNGSILVRLRKEEDTTQSIPPSPEQEKNASPNPPAQQADTTPSNTTPSTTPSQPPLQPLGLTPTGEPILASYTTTRDCHADIYFQFWGPAATGSLGETFTHVAVASGLAVWEDELRERRIRAELDMAVARVPVVPPVVVPMALGGGRWWRGGW